MSKYMNLKVADTMEKITQDEFCNSVSRIFERAETENLGIVIYNSENYRTYVFCAAEKFDYYFDDDFGYVVNLAIIYAINKYTDMPDRVIHFVEKYIDRLDLKTVREAIENVTYGLCRKNVTRSAKWYRLQGILNEREKYLQKIIAKKTENVICSGKINVQKKKYTVPDIEKARRLLIGGQIPVNRESYKKIDNFFDIFRQIAPDYESNWRDIWIRVPRGTIEDFANYDELIKDDIVENYKEYEELWFRYYPDAEKWYELSVMENEGHRIICLGGVKIFEQCEENKPHSDGTDITRFMDSLIVYLHESINKLKRNEYDEMLAKELPYINRLGIIKRQDYWKIDPVRRLREKIKLNDNENEMFELYINENKQSDIPKTRLHEMNARKYFELCSIWYKYIIYGFKTTENPRDSYLTYADRRNSGLSDINEKSAEDFNQWFNSNECQRAYPWDISAECHKQIKFEVCHDNEGFYFMIRPLDCCEDLVKFYLELMQRKIPVGIYNTKHFIERMQGLDMLGICPQEARREQKKILQQKGVGEFIFLRYADEEKMRNIQWIDLPKTKLISELN